MVICNRIDEYQPNNSLASFHYYISDDGLEFLLYKFIRIIDMAEPFLVPTIYRERFFNFEFRNSELDKKEDELQ